MEPYDAGTMRGIEKKQGSMLMLLSPESRVPAMHPLRAFKKLADATLMELNPTFDAMYSGVGRPSIPPERLLVDHEVAVSENGRHALNRLNAGERFDVILCDLMMPELMGMELHAEMKAVAPDQVERMIFVTGGAFTPSGKAFLDAVPNARIEKPFDPATVRALVRALVRWS
jgi:CheY-like chemotaxis protein